MGEIFSKYSKGVPFWSVVRYFTKIKINFFKYIYSRITGEVSPRYFTEQLSNLKTCPEVASKRIFSEKMCGKYRENPNAREIY